MMNLRTASGQSHSLFFSAICFVFIFSCSTAEQEGAGTIENEENLPLIEKTPPLVEATNIDCAAGGGKAGTTGEKIWCWGDISIPEYTEAKGVLFSNDELKTNSECYENQVTVEGNRIKFSVNPTNPAPESWCERYYNMRAEISTAPWNIEHPVGTEEWFGWTYEFGADYKADLGSPWIMFQCHNGIVGENPLISLWLTSGEGQFHTGEITLVNTANSAISNQYHPTGVFPTAGQKLKIVAHVIWGDDTTGLVQIWIDETKVHDVQSRTIQTEAPFGGNAKWGIYKWKWADGDYVQLSQEQGITHLETYMGTLRIVTRKPGDPEYGNDAYELVKPD